MDRRWDDGLRQHTPTGDFFSNELRGNLSLSELPIGLIARYMTVMVGSGCFVGFFLAGMFGRRGLIGWLVAALAGAIATTASGLAGSLIWHLPDLMSGGWQSVDIFSVAAGAMVLPFAVSDWPLLMLVCPAVIFVTHVWVRQLRRN